MTLIAVPNLIRWRSWIHEGDRSRLRSALARTLLLEIGLRAQQLDVWSVDTP